MENDKIDNMVKYIEIEETSGFSFNEEEREVALNILRQLKGLTIFRATKILNFCLKAICITKI